MKITKTLMLIAIIISIVWIIKSNFEYEPITVLLGFIINFISLNFEEKKQLNKINFKKGNSQVINQSNESGSNQENDLQVGGKIGTINQINQ